MDKQAPAQSSHTSSLPWHHLVIKTHTQAIKLPAPAPTTTTSSYGGGYSSSYPLAPATTTTLGGFGSGFSTSHSSRFSYTRESSPDNHAHFSNPNNKDQEEDFADNYNKGLEEDFNKDFKEDFKEEDFDANPDQVNDTCGSNNAYKDNQEDVYKDTDNNSFDDTYKDDTPPSPLRLTYQSAFTPSTPFNNHSFTPKQQALLALTAAQYSTYTWEDMDNRWITWVP
ncbi:hypothetical protein IWZ00DRAFT_492451 [Phyllosticta capitalensis]